MPIEPLKQRCKPIMKKILNELNKRITANTLTTIFFNQSILLPRTPEILYKELPFANMID